MNAIYRVQISYPSGRVELIDQDFKTGSEALEYGNSMITQIANTEQFHSGADEEFGVSLKKEPYFFIIEVKKNKQKVVYDSRN